MANPKLTNEQRATLLEWLAADYDSKLIKVWFSENGWPNLSRAALTYYRKEYAIDIETIRLERRNKAFTTGLALKAERIERLKKHADALEAIKWEPDEHGKLWNEKAWRETVRQIAEEMGQLKQVVEMRLPRDVLFDRMRELGLTLEDVRQDSIAVELFRRAGIDVTIGADLARGESSAASNAIIDSASARGMDSR